MQDSYYILFDAIKSMKIKGLHTAPVILSSENQMAPDSRQPSTLLRVALSGVARRAKSEDQRAVSSS